LVPLALRNGSWDELASEVVFLGLEDDSGKFLTYSFRENRILPARTATWSGDFFPKDKWKDFYFEAPFSSADAADDDDYIPPAADNVNQSVAQEGDGAQSSVLVKAVVRTPPSSQFF
jgi:hypothetical protein